MTFRCPQTNTGIAYFDTVSLRRIDIPTFDPHEGSLIGWMKIPDWTDGVIDTLIKLGADATNYISIEADSNSCDHISL